MARNLSPRAIKSAQALESDDPWLVLLEIAHPTWATPFRMVDNTVDVVSNGDTYIAWPFDLVMGDDDGEHLPEIKLTIDNVDRALVEIIRTTVNPPVMAIQIVLASQIDTVEVLIRDLTLREVEYDAQTITWTLYAESLADQRYPADTISLSSGYLGLFRI
jgi:hypothetical protein